MSADHHDREADDAISRLSNALRQSVPLREEWRRAVLQTIDALPAQDRRHTGNITESIPWIRRRWNISPAAGIAAALCFAAVGAGAGAMFLRPDPGWPPAEIARSGHASGMAAGAQLSPGGDATGATSVRFVIVAPHASRVALVGDFNGWSPTAMPMQRSNGDAWVRDVELEPGRHAYAFMVDGEFQIDPSAPRAAEDDFGIPSSALVVRNVRQ
jgi:hypothetical protein